MDRAMTEREREREREALASVMGICQTSVVSAPIKASGYILLPTSKHVLISSLVLQATLAVTYIVTCRTLT